MGQDGVREIYIRVLRMLLTWFVTKRFRENVRKQRKRNSELRRFQGLQELSKRDKKVDYSHISGDVSSGK
jgi:hypothetical protein